MTASPTGTHEPLRPVIINKHGEALIGLSPSPDKPTLQHEDSFFDGSRHSGECNGFVKRIVVSPTKAVICCHDCGLREHIGGNIHSFRELRRYFPEHNYPATASVHRYPETPPPTPSPMPQENADGELIPHRHISTKEEDAHEDSRAPHAYSDR